MEMPTKNMFHKTNCQTVSSIRNSSTLVKNAVRKAMYDVSHKLRPHSH